MKKISILHYTLIAMTLAGTNPMFARAEDPVPPTPPAPTSTTRVQGEGSAGVAVQTTTGAGADLNGSVRVTNTGEAGDSTGYSASAHVVAGSTASGQSQLPTVQVDARRFIGDQVPQPGENSAVNIFFGARFNRNVPMGTQADGAVYAGWAAMAQQPTSNGDRTLKLEARGELGAGNTGSIAVLPYLQVRALGSYEQCMRVSKSSDKHKICGKILAEANVGLIQVGLGVGVAGEYRYQIADGQDGKSKVDFFAGPTAQAAGSVDLNGAHGMGFTGLSIGIRGL